MTKITKTLLFLAVAGTVTGLLFVSGLVDVKDASALYVALPLGAVFFGLFLISRMLEKEAALHDQEYAASTAAAHSLGSKTPERCAGRPSQQALAT